ncbi:MAG: hypothetical protein M3545_06405 [Acidobacteriota bacterium]|nr:hypothetical protein [Acidobacteriota bacterium]
MSLGALRLLWAFEERGCIVRCDGDQLLVGPRQLITDHERVSIRQHRDELVALVKHCESVQ